jgi:uncharacterized protein
MLAPIEHRIAVELGVRPAQVVAAIALLDEGATVPFIARYRKEATGGLDDTQLRNLEERLTYLRDLEDRRTAILASIEEQGKLTPELKAEIDDAETKQRLEDLYLPYKQKRRTKAQIAREAGIEPLALGLLENPELTPEEEAGKFLNAEAGFADAKAVLDGARQILMEKFAEDAGLLGQLREYLKEHGLLRSTVVEGKESEGAKFRDWFAFAEPIASMPSHRALALLRGRNEGILHVALVLDSDLDGEKIQPGPGPCEQRIAVRFGIRNQNRPADKWLADTVRWTWKVKVHTHLELELVGELRERAEEEAIRIFGKNLKDLLLAAPAGQHVTMGIDPGIRTGCKIAVVDATGKLLDTATIYPHEPRCDWDGSLADHRPPGREAPGQPGRHRQRHGQPRNRQAGPGRHETLPGSAAAENRRLRSRRLGLFRLRTGGQGIPRPRRFDPRRRLDRPPPAGPARRTGQDRAEVDRRRPVPARRVAEQAGAQP